jgi:hypothetical protein
LRQRIAYRSLGGSSLSLSLTADARAVSDVA